LPPPHTTLFPYTTLFRSGVLISVLGAPVAIAIDAVSFLASVAGVTLVRAKEPEPRPQVHQHHPITEIVEGWRALIGHPVLRAFRSEEHTSELQSRENLVC